MSTRIFSMVWVLVIFAGPAGLVSCGKSDQTFSYHFTINGCDTAEHFSSTLAEECGSLQNEALNNGCAQTLRKDFFAQIGCTGDFTPY
ncbi:hypothetical protein WDW37_02220 [Bdellovibrionota bacterium FG-1]